MENSFQFIPAVSIKSNKIGPKRKQDVNSEIKEIFKKINMYILSLKLYLSIDFANLG